MLSRAEIAHRIQQLPPEKQAEATRFALQVYGVENNADRTLSTKYRFSTGQYIREKLGWEPWAGDAQHPGQAEVIAAYELALRQQHEREAFEAGELTPDALQWWQPGQIIKNELRVEAGHTVGKCVILSDVITLSDGKRMTAEKLIGKSFKLLTLVNGKPTEVEARAEFNAVEPVYEIITETGKRVTRNGRHPLYAAEAEFCPGRRPKITEKGFIPLTEIKPSDLVAVAEELPAFGNSRLPDYKIKLLAYLLGDGGYTRDSVRFSQKAGVQLEEFKQCAVRLGCCVKYIGQYDWIVYGQYQRKKKGSNPLLNLLREMKMMKIHSRDKRVPDIVYQLPRKKLQLFLNRLFATDGWAASSKGDQREIGFCSASRGLVEDVAHLLQRLGIHCRVAPKHKVNAWVLIIKDANDQMAFIERVGIFGKEAALAAIAAKAGATRDRKNAQVALRPDRPRWCYKNAPQGTRWEKVKSVTRLPEPQPTVAIEVPEHHTFLTSFWEHNTKLSSGLVNHFFDCFTPSIIYTFAPTWVQIHDLLWKEIKSDRRGAGLPGRILDLRLEVDDNHFATGRATNDNGGRGTEKVQGQHGKYLMFVLDEAEGVPDFVWSAVDSMTSGGISIVLMLANPRTRKSKFHKRRTLSTVRSFRISCLHHPNVVAGREIVPGAVKRQYVEGMIEKHCEVAAQHEHDQNTFALPFPVTTEDGVLPTGTIFLPNAEFLFRVLGKAPANLADNSFVPVGRYEAACNRTRDEAKAREPHKVRMGVDVARWGADAGTLYVLHDGAIRRVKQFWKVDTQEYSGPIKAEALRIWNEAPIDEKPSSLHIRIDGTGGFGGGVVDALKNDETLKAKYSDFKVLEVHFGSNARDKKAYDNIVTEMYAEAAETIKGIAIEGATEALEEDLCERTFEWINREGVAVKRLTDKEKFKKDHKGRSCDDGDGFGLAAAPDHIFKTTVETSLQSNVWDALNNGVSARDALSNEF